MDNQQNWTEVIELREKLWELLKNYWLNETLFSFNWWLLLISTIGFVVIWLRLLDKKRVIEIVAFGLMVSVFAFVLDVTGIVMVLWSYPDRLIPVLTPILEIHKFDMPIVYMIIYQYFNTWKRFTIAITITAFIFAFILEPLLVWLGIYEMHHWKYIYSFPIFIVIGITVRSIILKLKKIELKQKEY